MPTALHTLLEAARGVVLYHGTRPANVEAILRDGIKRGPKETIIFASESKADALEFSSKLDYPKVAPSAVIKIEAPKGSFFWEKNTITGKNEPKGNRTARFVLSMLPPEWLSLA